MLPVTQMIADNPVIDALNCVNLPGMQAIQNLRNRLLKSSYYSTGNHTRQGKLVVYFLTLTFYRSFR